MSVEALSLLSEAGAVARRLTGFEVRPQQLEMATAVQECLASRGRLLVEAGTGVGKSFAYLIPAIERIVTNRERVVISTHTINLQEQLIEKDIPLLNAVIPDEFSAVLVKGRGNYLSLRRLRLASGRAERLFGSEEEQHSLQMIEDWAYQTTDGSLSTLPQLTRPGVWDHAQSDANNCMGRQCPTYEKCFYQAARRRMERGDLLVCNHAIFFADLALRSRGAAILPPYQHVILDEAHEAESVAGTHFGVRLSEARVQHLLRTLFHAPAARGFLATLPTRGPADRQVEETILHVQRCVSASDEFFERLAQRSRSGGEEGSRLRAADDVEDTLSGSLRELAAGLRALRGGATQEDEFELTAYAARTEELAAAASLLTGQQLPGCVYWIEGARRGRKRSGLRSVTLACAAVDVAPILREQLFAREISVVMTSATLACKAKDFSATVTQLGCDDARTLQLGSPFDHARQVQLFIDPRMPSPESLEFQKALEPRVLEQIKATDGGAFVLFTSFSMLDAVAQALEPALRELGHPVLVQGRGVPRGLLLARFREDERSVLFGTSSFWQGIDVRGRTLRNVIICKLPFDVPNLPLVEARRELIESRGGNAFMDDQLPRAVLKFRQGFGRLIRSSTDTGRVVVLDPRIVTKRYGRAFLDALPEGVEAQSLDDGVE